MQADIQCTACGARFTNPLCQYCRDNTPPPDPDAFEAAKEADLRDEPPIPTTPQ